MSAIILETIETSNSFNEKVIAGDIGFKQAEEFRNFLTVINHEFLKHRVVTSNRYTKWFQKGQATKGNLIDLTIQFSVFSNNFLIAQLKKMINSRDITSMRLSKEILANEIGVVFKSTKPKNFDEINCADLKSEDLDLLGLDGSIDGSHFHFKAAHFEWLVDFAKPLDINFNELGRLSLGSENTQFFCRELERLYGNENPSISAGAGFAVENWAAAGFWQELVDGLTHIKKTWLPQLPLHFWSWHNLIEKQHAQHTHHELEDLYFNQGIDERKFLESGRQILFAVETFWEGLFESVSH